jgi:nitrogen fixation protein
MLKKVSRLGKVVILVVVPLLAVTWLTVSGSEEGMAQEIGIQYPPLPTCDYATVPQSVIDKAVEMATELVGNSHKKLQIVTDQLLATYVEAKDRDIIVVFNSGGWGWNITRSATGWGSILDGIKAQLDSQGYETSVLNYRRTSSGLTGIAREFVEATRDYPHKADDLATRIRFLTDSLPNLKVIIAGESTGTVISDKTMSILKDEPRVYSIQTGTPFWHKPTILDRTLLVNDNGAILDTFSRGNIPAMIWGTVKGWFGLSSSDDLPGDIMLFLKAPGHDYSWQYPGVYNAVVGFLKTNFSQAK